VGFAGSRGSTGSLASSSDEVTLVGTIEVPPDRAHVTKAHHRVASELTLKSQVIVHSIRRAQVRVIGVNAHRLKEGKVDWASRCGRAKRELIGFTSCSGNIRERSGKCW